METRANYVLVGAFTLAGFIGLLLFLTWFARVELDRQFDYYDVEFSTVSGLSNASEVQFGGLLVGRVVSVGLAPDGSGQIRVRIEVAAETPVRTSSTATIESLGVTGVSFVSLSAGDPRDPLLTPRTVSDVPTIQSERSVLQTLTEDAPTIVEEVLSVTRQLGEILGPENQARVSNVLANLELSSGDLGRALTDFSTVADTIASSSEEIAAFTSRLEEISAAAVKTLEAADETLASVTAAVQRSESTLDRGDAALDSGRKALESADTFINRDLPALVDELKRTTESVRVQLDQVGGDAGEMMAEFRKTGAAASGVLGTAEETLRAVDTTLADVSAAADAFETAAAEVDLLLSDSGAALVADARAFISEARRVVDSAAAMAETDLPAIVEEIRIATETASGVVAEVGADLSSAAGRVDEISANVATTLDTVTGTFASANETLGRLNTAIETGDSALSAADRAFASADRFLDDDLAPLAADLRSSLARLDSAIAQVTEDLPVIASELRAAAESANSAFGEIGTTASRLSPSLRSFADEGLPQYSRLARETRDLVGNLDRLVTRIERDPARQFLGREDPVFRR